MLIKLLIKKYQRHINMGMKRGAVPPSLFFGPIFNTFSMRKSQEATLLRKSQFMFCLKFLSIIYICMIYINLMKKHIMFIIVCCTCINFTFIYYKATCDMTHLQPPFFFLWKNIIWIRHSLQASIASTHRHVHVFY
jgi:hypothetical protein